MYYYIALFCLWPFLGPVTHNMAILSGTNIVLFCDWPLLRPVLDTMATVYCLVLISNHFVLGQSIKKYLFRTVRGKSPEYKMFLSQDTIITTTEQRDITQEHHTCLQHPLLAKTHKSLKLEVHKDQW